MSPVVKGTFEGKGRKFVIVASSFNEFVGQSLVEGCRDMLLKHAVKDDDILVIWVPGSFEIPTVVSHVLNTKRKDLDAVICLGALIRGETPHFDYLAAEVTKGIAALSLQYIKPVVYGIITTDTLEQAIERAGAKQGNKGRDAALVALEMVNVLKNIDAKG